jgi:integrase
MALVVLGTYARLGGGACWQALRRREPRSDRATVRIERTQVRGRRTESARVRPSPGPAAASFAFPPTLVFFFAADQPRHLAEYVGEGPDALVFTGPTGARLRRKQLRQARRLVSEPVAAIGAPGLHFHDLRHTGNGFAARVPGTTIRDLMSRMGHDSTRAALDLPTRLTGADRIIADALPSSWTATKLTASGHVGARDSGKEVKRKVHIRAEFAADLRGSESG